jgi:hypothetical protein
LAASRWTASLVGEIATHAIVWAAAQRVASRTSSAAGARAVDWIRQQFEQTVAKALADGPSRFVLRNAEEATDLVAGYAEAIGDVERALPGEDHELDEFLRPQPL